MSNRSVDASLYQCVYDEFTTYYHIKIYYMDDWDKLQGCNLEDLLTHGLILIILWFAKSVLSQFQSNKSKVRMIIKACTSEHPVHMLLGLSPRCLDLQPLKLGNGEVISSHTL